MIFGDLGNDWLVGGTGKDTLYGGWGNDLSNADDDASTHDTATASNDPADRRHARHASATRTASYGGAGHRRPDRQHRRRPADRLGRRVQQLHRAVRPFGIATVSRQVQRRGCPSSSTRSRRATAPTRRATPTPAQRSRGRARNGEPTARSASSPSRITAYWQDADRRPDRSAARQHPRRRGATCCVGATSTTARMTAFAVDTRRRGRSRAARSRSRPRSLGQDAAAVFYLDEYLPIYYEIVGAGHDAEADRRLEGERLRHLRLLLADRLQVRRHRRLDRTSSSWATATRPAGTSTAQAAGAGLGEGGHLVRPARRRQRHDGDGARSTATQAFTHTFAPRIIDGEPVGLNKGFVGVGSDNSRGSWDNFIVQALPPQLTLDTQTSFTGGAGPVRRRPAVRGRSTAGVTRRRPPTGDHVDERRRPRRRRPPDELVRRDHRHAARRAASAACVFDRYGVEPLQVRRARRGRASGSLIGHVAGGNWVVDASVGEGAGARTPTTRVVITIKGTSVSVSVNGVFAVSFAFNAPVADGARRRARRAAARPRSTASA